MAEFNFGMLRCRNEGLVVGLWIRASARAWVWRWVDIREPIWERLEGRESHWGVASRSFWDEGERGAEVRREERRRISSRSSVGSVAGVLVGGLDLEIVVGVVERSRLLSAVRMRWDFAARIRALLRVSVTASRSFCAGWCFVEPFAFRMLFARVACRAANLGLLCSIESSIGGSILAVVLREECCVLTRLFTRYCTNCGEDRAETRFEPNLIAHSFHQLDIFVLA